ncbi:DNA starvation/stationary phase protection protein [Staphylococcus sp. HMSC059E03]|uniref:Dps family protein n=1 Tax=Staphylococcus TaxID=1279 RepID=UPI000764277B|nr:MULTISPECIES: Dps family protein [Staphylococcus]KXA44989.1 DNA protection during starvation protein 2 [Staphylococcus simulans]OFM18005.1 DNA starvation/stationary phase protection protein [Staphylococcus sp. HMSC059E03]OFN22338.1 DNA starvation/stationary phase protection protein [Staphylococcus sp. HMSC055C03]OFV04768.1 DNA starvation/stationary phase protection protein [Staphylococcus sp. HMSC12H08]
MANKQDVVNVLNEQVANWTVLYTKIHNFHWFVKGPHFFSLHVKFEELYNEASEHIDELAERILAIGGSPVATLKNSLDVAIVDEAESEKTAEDMVQSISKDFTNISEQLAKAVEVAGDAEDDVSQDMLIALQTSVDKHKWMFQSFLGK